MRHSTHTARAAVGATPHAAGVSYCTWAPDQSSVGVEVDHGGASGSIDLAPAGGGYWSGLDPDGRPGDLYHFRLSDGPLVPDVASRFQPLGVNGPSECVDPFSYAWATAGWRRPRWSGQTTYEVHVGALTRAGTFRSAIGVLPHIRELGVEAIELMPVADFAGERNWGYDGVALFAPARCYGRPDDLRALVDAAHGLGLAAIIDVVYNHVGPQGSQLGRYTARYLGAGGDGQWGRGFNLDGEDSRPVRDLIVSNVLYWLEEFRLDGLRIDAAHAIADRSPRHILEEICEAAHGVGAFVVAEDARNCAALVSGASGVDAIWADDFHHQARVCMAGVQDGYYSAYSGSPGAIEDTISHGWYYRGQPFGPWKGSKRGTGTQGVRPESFVYCIENHDQVGNRAQGERLEHLVTPAQFRAASMLLCLGPHAALLFMGQDWAASSPFLFFSDHGGDIGRGVSAGRGLEHGHTGAPDPESPDTFERSKLRWEETGEGVHAKVGALYRAALGHRLDLRSAGAMDAGAWRAWSAGNFIFVEYRVPLAVRVLVTALGPGQPGLPPAPGPGAWTALLNSNWARFGGSLADGERTLAFPEAGSVWLERPEKG